MSKQKGVKLFVRVNSDEQRSRLLDALRRLNFADPVVIEDESRSPFARKPVFEKSRTVTKDMLLKLQKALRVLAHKTRDNAVKAGAANIARDMGNIPYSEKELDDSFLRKLPEPAYYFVHKRFQKAISMLKKIQDDPTDPNVYYLGKYDHFVEQGESIKVYRHDLFGTSDSDDDSSYESESPKHDKHRRHRLYHSA